ncbi:MAG: hypothetical protein KAU01_12865, partial [Candidatus Cloacimonetes bacterium]|nr:hypothetical protein [Candidatus Cloacimonadota bacterium]
MKNKLLLTMFGLLMISFLSAEYVSIYDIQYTEATSGDSPYEGEVVTTNGIVTGSGFSGYNDNFFISMPEGGAWSGLYIFAANIEPNLGDEIEITGEISEYYNFTEIAYGTATTLSSGNPVPDPAQITTHELATEEMYESVLVTIFNVEVTETPNSYNEWYVDDDSGECQIDDGFYEYINPQIGDEFLFITGIIDYNFYNYALNPRNANDLVLGGIGAIVYENYPAVDEDVLVQFSYYDSCDVLLWWKTSRDYDFDEYIEMTTERSIEYYATIPGQKEGTTVYFYITAKDSTGTIETFPTGDPKKIFYGVTSHRAILNIPAKPFDPYAGEKFPIEFASQKDDKAILRIYNAEGKLVYTPQNIIIS